MSMKQLSETSSAIIGSLVVTHGETGPDPTATGSARPKRFPRPAHPFCAGDPLTELPTSLRAIVSDGTALLISWLRFGESPLHENYLGRAIPALEALAASFAAIDTPAEPGEILDVLHMVAETVQVDLPEEAGLTMYVALLAPLPVHVLKLAALEVLKTHAVRTLPLPAEFLQSQEVVSWYVARRWLPMMLARWLADLKQRQLMMLPSH